MFNDTVKIIPFPYIENAYVIISFHKNDRIDFDISIDTVITFLYDAGNVAAEWEPKYGPIQIWVKAEEETDKTKKHYFYPFVEDIWGNWSQLAVETEQLKEYLIEGNYKYIFYVLKKWTENR